MCIAPIRIVGPDGLTEVACRKCWQCEENRINDWVGRCIAESKTAGETYAVTLTYGRDEEDQVDHLRAALLTYSDVQKYLKLLRFHGYAVRYLVTGEYGSAKGRAHWHIMLFFEVAAPWHELDRNFMHWRMAADGTVAKDTRGADSAFWPHGYSFWTKPTHRAVRYNCKYINKDVSKSERQGHLGMSRMPPLGAAYFYGLAERYVKAGLIPQDLKYSWPDVVNKKRKPLQFILSGRMADLYLDHYIHTWRRLRPGRHMPNSVLVEEYMDKLAPPRGPGGLKERTLTPGCDRIWGMVKFLRRREVVQPHDPIDMRDFMHWSHESYEILMLAKMVDDMERNENGT